MVRLIIWVVMILLVPLLSAAEILSTPNILKSSQQLILVLAPTWDSKQATLNYYDRAADRQPWRLNNKKAIAVMIGKNGLAWDSTRPHSVGLVKREGDGKSPAGVYRLGTAFGFSADSKAIANMRWQYLPLQATSICVDDVASPYYNQLIDSTAVVNWDPKTSGEHMLSIFPQYNWGIVVKYNEQNIKGAGSCIFMHVWKDPSKGTAGCVVMDETNLTQLLSWLNSEKNPVIVLLPRSVYEEIKAEWSLP